MKRTDGTKFKRTTPEQLAYIVEHWATQTCGEIETATGVRRQTVKSIASRLKLRKNPETLRSIRAAVNACRINRRGTKPRVPKPPVRTMPSLTAPFRPLMGYGHRLMTHRNLCEATR